MIRRILVGLGIVACLMVLGLATINLVWPQRDGFLALTQVFAPYLTLALLVFLPLCLLRGADVRLLRILLLVCGAVFLVRFLPGAVSLPRTADPGAVAVGATTWNLELGLADPGTVVEVVRGMPAGVVGLVELTHAHSDPIAADPAIALRFPYQVLKPRGGITGLGLLSSWPIDEGWTFSYDPPSPLRDGHNA